MYEIRVLWNRCLTTPLFCIYALRSSLECKIRTAVEPFLEKNNNYLSGKVLFLPSKFLFPAAIDPDQTLSVSIGRMIGQYFVLLNFAPNPCAQLDG